MPNFKEFIKGFEEKPEAEQPMQEQPKPKEHEITEAKLPESRFLKNDPYYKLVEEKKPKAYREHLFYPEGGKIALHGTSGERLGEFASEDEIKEFVDKKYDKPQEQPKPKKTVGEDLQEMYEKEFFKQANGNKEDFVNHFINRFGVPKGSSKKREAEFYGKRFDEISANQPKPKFQDELEGIVQGMKEDEQKEYDERFLNDATMHLTEGLSPEEKAEVNKRFKALLDKEGFENITPETRYKEGSFERAFGDNQPREEFSQEDKAALVATYGAFPEEGIVARKLPNGNYLTNILSGPDTEPEEVDEATLSKVFDELRGEKGFEETINEWRENPNLIRERRNVQ